MGDILGESLKQLKISRLRRTRLIAIVLALSLIVSLDVFWVLRQPGLTLAGDADCKIVEHLHDTYCTPCTQEEHVHTIECYADETADVETALDWQNMFADYPYTGDLRKDLVGIAQTQVGYTESVQNFEVDGNGVRRGYTRYGAWYGAPYHDWSAIFVSFCLQYAGADPEQFPGNLGANSMAERWNALGKYEKVGTYTPLAGDLVFFTDNTVGIVTQVQLATVQVVRADMDNAVQAQTVTMTDPSITGWGITEVVEIENTVPEATVPETTAPETTVPETTVPETTVPEATIPEATAPEATAPETTVPETTVPETTEPEATVPEATVPEVTEPQAGQIDEALLDISNGPAVFIIESQPRVTYRMQRFSLRTSDTAKDLISYLENNKGNYFFTLLDLNNKELPKDENGNYVAQANQGYKLTLTFNSPEGFTPGTYQYQIPNGLLVDGGEGVFKLKDDTVVGSWVVTDTGLITLDFNENINNHTDITISSTLGIHFPEQEDPLDFDGKITVSVEKPPPQLNPTILNKWGNQGGTPNATGTDPTKLYWRLEIKGQDDSQIVGNIITDHIILGQWSKTHRFTQSDMDAGLTFGVGDPAGGWHAWTVHTDDPHLIWTEYGWSYKMPTTVTCQWCGEITLGDAGWTYYIDYSSTPDRTGTAGTFGYENDATVDGAYGYSWVNFTHGEIVGEIQKNGAFASDAAGGGFLWEFQALIPGRVEGQKAVYHWYIWDYMSLLDGADERVKRVHNDANLSTVYVTYNGNTFQIPQVQDATDQDMFAWDNAWDATDDGITHGREFNLLCRCQCTKDTCFWGESCGEYWYEIGPEKYAQNGFCQCWTPTEETVFTFVYKTEDLSLIEQYGGMDYELYNEADLYFKPDEDSASLVDSSSAKVPIPDLFKKQLTHDFDGYTANYKITVNEAKVVLTDGAPLHIHDAMTKTLAYISGSLVITAEDANGNVTTLVQGDDYTVDYDGTGQQTDDKGNVVHTLDIVILHPQPVMYTLDYDATLIFPDKVTESIKYANSAEITLWGESVKDNAAEKVYADITISTKSYKVQLQKVCEETGKPLSGAIFGLYNENGGLIAQAVTNANGQLTFQTNITQGIILREHVPYYMQEIQAPEGYRLSDTQYWFCFCDQGAAFCSTCNMVLADLDGVRIPLNQQGNITATNAYMPYALPSTGGIGVYPIIYGSVVFILTPLVYISILRRKRERRGVG